MASRRSWTYGIYVAFIHLVLGTPLKAEPPAVTYLYPGGVQRGASVEITAGGVKSWPVQVWTDRQDLTVSAGKNKGKLQVKTTAKTRPGIAWIRLYNQDGASSLRPFLIGTLPEVSEREPNNTHQAPQKLAGSTVAINGRLAANGDVDVFALSLRKGQTLVASLAANGALKSPMDGVLQILSPKGFILDQNHDHRGLDPQVTFQAPDDGKYLVRLFAFPAKPNSSIRFSGAENYVYRLTLTTAGFADHAWPAALPRSSPSKVEVVGWNIPAAARSLALTPINENSGIAFHPQLANAVHVLLEPHAASVENPSQNPQPVQVPVTITGRIARPGEVDAFEFSLKKGQRIQVEIETRALGSPVDPVLQLTDTNGKVLNRAQSSRQGTPPTITVTAKADTTYRIQVLDLLDGGGMRYVYCLRLAPPRPDYTVQVAGDRFTLTPGKLVEIPVTITRRNGFKATLDIRAEGLPAGLTAPNVQATVKAKKVTLKVSGKGKPVSGPFQIVAQPKGGPRRAAKATIAELGTSTSHLWITLSAQAKPKK